MSIIHSGSSLREALVLLETSSSKIILISSPSGAIISVLTESDIRHALLNDCPLSTPVDDFSTQDFIFVTNNTQDYHLEAERLAHAHSLRSIPVLNPDNTFDHILNFTLFDHIDADFFILAGGKGTRLGELTKNTPKPMIPVNGTPLLHQLISRIASYKKSTIYLSVNYLKEKIIDYFGDGSSFGVNIKYIEESSPLGTAGSLSLINDTPQSQNLIIMNADVVTTIDFSDIFSYHCSNNSDFTVASHTHRHSIPYGVLECKDRRLISITEKPSISCQVSAGIYVLKTSLLPLIPYNTYFDMPDLMELLTKSPEIRSYIYPVYEYWLDVGTKENLNKLDSYPR